MVAIARLSELREPALAGAWLRTIVRNKCLIERRGRRPTVLPEALNDVCSDADELLDGHAL